MVSSDPNGRALSFTVQEFRYRREYTFVESVGEEGKGKFDKNTESVCQLSQSTFFRIIWGEMERWKKNGG